MNKFYLLCFMGVLLASCTDDDFEYQEPQEEVIMGDHLIMNDHLLVLDYYELTHNGGISGVSFEEESGYLQMDRHHIDTIYPGIILLIDKGDAEVILRRVSQVEEQGENYVLLTAAAGIEDVFHNIDLSFDLTAMNLYKGGELASMSKDQLSQALTDEKGNLHPVEVWKTTNEGRELVYSAIQTSLTQGSAPASNRFELSHQFNVNYPLYESPVVDLVLKDFGFALETDLILKYKTEVKKFRVDLPWPLKDLHVPYKGHMTTSMKASDVDLTTWADVEAVAEATSVPLTVEVPITVVTPRYDFSFLVGTVPVIISVSWSLNIQGQYDIGGKVRATTGFQSTMHVDEIRVGGGASFKGSISGIKKLGVSKMKDLLHMDFNRMLRTFSSVFTVDPDPVHQHFSVPKVTDARMRDFELDAMATFNQAVTVNPTVGLAFYQIAGPEVKLAMGAKITTNVGAGMVIDPTHLEDNPEVYLGWDNSLYPKFGAGAGVWIPFLDKHIATPVLPLMQDFEIWHSPSSMEKSSDLGAMYTGDVKSVEVVVKDAYGLPAPLMFVKWETDHGGDWQYPITMTDYLGRAQNSYRANRSGTYNPYCLVKDGSMNEVSRIEFEVIAVK